MRKYTIVIDEDQRKTLTRWAHWARVEQGAPDALELYQMIAALPTEHATSSSRDPIFDFTL
jgi:hypothetical protein